jgi:hypothetical protein
MSVHHEPSRSTPRSWTTRYGAAAAVAVVASAALLASAGTAQAVGVLVPMGTAEPFAVLAGTGITVIGTSTVNGDIGSFPTPVMTLTGSLVLTGTDHAGDGVTQGAKTDLTAAYLDAAGQGSNFSVVADLAGQTLVPGVYTTASGLEINGPTPLILDAGGNPNAIFIFQAGSSLITQPGTSVLLINGATACNVFWQVTTSTTLGVNSVFRGQILTLQSSSLNTGATLEGSVLSRNGAVTLDSNTILRPPCATPVTGGTSTVSAPLPAGTTGQVRRVPVGSVNAGGGPVTGRLWSS